MEPVTKTPKEILTEALESEDETRAFFQALAGRTADATVREKMLELADRELSHRATLERKYRERIGEEPPPPREMKVSIPPDHENLDLPRALKLALERERDSESYYRFLAERVAETPLGNLFWELAEIEWKHKIEMQNEYDAVSVDPESFLLDM